MTGVGGGQELNFPASKKVGSLPPLVLNKGYGGAPSAAAPKP